MTKFFKNNQKQPIKEVEPRSMDEINKEYSDLIGKLGIEEFKAHVQSENIRGIKMRLLQVNEEANKRTEMDKKAQENKEVKNEQV